MSHDPKVAGRVARILDQWWTASALNEKSAAEAFRAQMFDSLSNDTAATTPEIVAAFDALHGKTTLWSEFLTAQSASDRKRIANAVASVVLCALPVRAPKEAKAEKPVKAPKEVKAEKPVKDPTVGGKGTDPRYFEPPMPLSLFLAINVPFFLLLLVLSMCGRVKG